MTSETEQFDWSDRVSRMTSGPVLDRLADLVKIAEDGFERLANAIAEQEKRLLEGTSPGAAGGPDADGAAAQSGGEVPGASEIAGALAEATGEVSRTTEQLGAALASVSEILRERDAAVERVEARVTELERALDKTRDDVASAAELVSGEVREDVARAAETISREIREGFARAAGSGGGSPADLRPLAVAIERLGRAVDASRRESEAVVRAQVTARQSVAASLRVEMLGAIERLRRELAPGTPPTTDGASAQARGPARTEQPGASAPAMPSAAEADEGIADGFGGPTEHLDW